MKIFKKILFVLLMIAAVYTVFRGVAEFNLATAWLELFRGLFWMVLGWSVFWTCIGLLKGLEEK